MFDIVSIRNIKLFGWGIDLEGFSVAYAWEAVRPHSVVVRVATMWFGSGVISHVTLLLLGWHLGDICRRDKITVDRCFSSLCMCYVCCSMESRDHLFFWMHLRFGSLVFLVMLRAVSHRITFWDIELDWVRCVSKGWMSDARVWRLVWCADLIYLVGAKF